MTRFETSWETTELYVPYLETVNDKLAEMRRDCLVKLGKRSCEITTDGRAFLRNICMAFDARLVRKVPTTQIFSRTI